MHTKKTIRQKLLASVLTLAMVFGMLPMMTMEAEAADDKIKILDFALAHNDDGKYTISDVTVPADKVLVFAVPTQNMINSLGGEAQAFENLKSAFDNNIGQSVGNSKFTTHEFDTSTPSIDTPFLIGDEVASRMYAGVVIAICSEKDENDKYTIYEMGMTSPVAEGTTGGNLIGKETYTVTFDPNNGEATPPPVTVASNMVIPTPTWETYTLEGWYTDTTFADEATLDEMKALSSDTTVYAKWTNTAGKIVRTAPIEIDENTATTDKLSTEGWKWDKGTKTLTLDGLTMDVFDIPEDAFAISLSFTNATTNVILADSSSNSVTSNARGIDGAHRTTTFNGKGSLTTDTVGMGIAGTMIIIDGGTYDLTSSHQTISLHTLTVNDGTLNVETTGQQSAIFAGSQFIINGGEVTATAPSGKAAISTTVSTSEGTPIIKAGADKDNATDTTYTNQSYVNVKVAPPTYTVTFDPNNGGTTTTDETDADVAFPTPTWNSFYLEGWYKDTTFATKVTDLTALTANTTLYAKWQASASDPRPVNIVSDFIVTGGVNGIDYDFSTGGSYPNTLLIKTATEITIENFDKSTATSKPIRTNGNGITANITLAGVNISGSSYPFRAGTPVNLTLADGTVNTLNGGTALYTGVNLTIDGTGELRTISSSGASISGGVSIANTLEYAVSDTAMPDDSATYTRGTGTVVQFTGDDKYIRIKPSTPPTPPTPPSGGGGSSSGGSSSSNEPDVDVDKDTGNVSAKPDVSTQTNNDGTTTATPNQSSLEKAINEASEEKKDLESDGENSTADVVIEVNTNSKTKAVGMELIVENVDDMVEKDIDNLVITSDIGSVTLDQKALKAIADGKESGETVILIIREVEDAMAELTDEQKAIVGSEQVYELYIEVNGNRVSDFNGGTATVEVPDGLADDVSEIKVYYVDDEGNIEYKPTTYDKENGTITFVTDHFSHYLISTKTLDATLPFTDVDTDDWFYDSVQFVYQNGLMNGTSDTTFEPSFGTTRAMMAQVIWNMEGKPTINSASVFSDVSNNEWYSDTIAWTSENGIYKGFDDGTFRPNDNITREQLVAILYRYADFKGMDMTSGENTNILSYDDAFDISEYAIPAIQWAIYEDVISGKTENTLDPKGIATRAEIATILSRFTEKE